MSDLIATLPTVIAEGVVDRLTRQAREIINARPEAEAAEVTDTDAATLMGTLGAIRAKVQVVVPALALTGQDDGPADLVGRSPIDAATARELAGDNTTWDRLLTHPVTGTVLECDAYQPTAAMRRLLRARDRHCRFPGCRQPAIRCEIDHTHAASDGGPTHVSNLAHLCKRHHDVKHHTRWHVRQLAGGLLVWTSPTGRVYREDAPPPLVAFTIEAGPPPRPGASAQRARTPEAPPPF